MEKDIKCYTPNCWWWFPLGRECEKDLFFLCAFAFFLNKNNECEYLKKKKEKKGKEKSKSSHPHQTWILKN